MKHTILLGLRSFWKDFDKIYKNPLFMHKFGMCYFPFFFTVDYDLIILVETKI